MKRLLYLTLMLTVVLLSACKKDPVPEPGPQPGETAPQTVLMYLPWAGNLYEYLLRNIEDAKKAVAKNVLGNSRLLVFIQSGPQTGKLSEIYYDRGAAAEKVLKTYSGLNLTRMEEIRDLLKFVTEIAPARQYAMTVGSHGMAWIPYYYSAATQHTPDIPEEKPHWEYVSPDGQFTRWFGDGSTRNTNTTTLAEAISAAGIKMEYILFDNCFMSSIELAYDMRNAANYLIASPCEIMAYGFPFKQVLPQMFIEGGKSYSLEGICRNYYEFYEAYEAPKYNCGAIAVTIISEVEALASVMKRINTSYPDYVADPSKPLQRYEYLYSPTRFYDYGDYVHKLCKDPVLLAEFDAQLDRTVPPQYRLHTEYFYSAGKRLIETYSGISTSDPSTSSTVTAYRNQTGWYEATH